MLFSIAVPVMGQANFLRTALASIQAQTCHLQLAVMDATPDGSVQDVLNNYSKIISYRRHGADAGQAAAIQEGWDHTEGDVVAWLCADDYYFPYALEEVEKVFTAHPEVDVVYGDSVHVDREGNFLSYFMEIDNPDPSILKGCCISQPSCFVRRSALNEVGKINPDLHYIMDWDLWTRLYKAGATFHYLNKPLSAVRVYPETKTSSRSGTRYAEINRHLKSTVGFYTRIRSLICFYYYDLLTGEPSILDRILLNAITTRRQVRRFFGKHSEKKYTVLYGIESYTNKIDGECEILLPIYGGGSPCQIVIECKDAVVLQIHINGLLQEVAIVSEDKNSCKYVLDIDSGLIGSFYRINLKSSSKDQWQLNSLRILETVK